MRVKLDLFWAVNRAWKPKDSACFQGINHGALVPAIWLGGLINPDGGSIYCLALYSKSMQLYVFSFHFLDVDNWSVAE